MSRMRAGAVPSMLGAAGLHRAVDEEQAWGWLRGWLAETQPAALSFDGKGWRCNRSLQTCCAWKCVDSDCRPHNRVYTIEA